MFINYGIRGEHDDDDDDGAATFDGTVSAERRLRWKEDNEPVQPVGFSSSSPAVAPTSATKLREG